MNFFINFYKYDNFLIANKFLYMNYDYECISVSDGVCVRLTTSPPSCAECHEIWEPKPSGIRPASWLGGQSS